MSDEVKRVPVLMNHDSRPENVWGTVVAENGGFRVTMKPDHAFTKEELFFTFGNCGIEFSECRMSDKNEALIDQFFIKCWVAEKPTPPPRFPPGMEDDPILKAKRDLIKCAPESEVIRQRLLDWFDKNVRTYTFSTLAGKPDEYYTHKVEEGFVKLGDKMRQDLVAFVEQKLYRRPHISMPDDMENRFTVLVISGKPK